MSSPPKSTFPLRLMVLSWLFAGLSVPAQVASFSATPTSVQTYQRVGFTDTSTGTITSRTWDFGDGQVLTTTATSVGHAYTAVGQYTVSLKVAGGTGSNTATRANYITVTPNTSPVPSPVPVGAGSYAAFIPYWVAHQDEYFGLGARQIEDYAGNGQLHLDPAVTNRALPSNQWWTDVLVGDRSGWDSSQYPPRTLSQDAFGGELWCYPAMLDPGPGGFNLYFPNAWTPRGTGAAANLPEGKFATGTALPITGSINNGAGVFTPVKSLVTDWSDWGFRFKVIDGQSNAMQITLARGVPFVWTTCSGVRPRLGPGSATLYDTNNAVIPNTVGSTFTNSAFAFDYNGRSFGVFAPSNTAFKILTGNIIEAQPAGTNNYLVYGLLPSRTYLNEFAQYAYAQVTGTRMDYIYDRTNGRVATTWTLTTVPLQGTRTNTLQGWLPHHYRTTQNDLAFKPYTYLTPRGRMKLAAGTQFHLSYAFRGIAPVLPAPVTTGSSNEYVPARMTAYAQNFANGGHPVGGETYGAGKDLGVTAQYMMFARQLGLTNVETQLATALKNRLQDWFTYTPGEGERFFAWYPNWRALVGFSASYGSQAFNDNHFHYGYFLAATGLAGLTDPAWLSQYAPMAKLVAKQYANWDRNDANFPYFRCLDIWEGHSWAGGTGSGGGENQESSSEAMNAWVGLFLLGNATGDDAITAAGALGYAMESAAVNEYWQDAYGDNFPASYGRHTCGILWAGSLAYATYFDADPAWIYGIQMVPQNHWNNYLTRDKVFARSYLTNMFYERWLCAQLGQNGLNPANLGPNTIAQFGGYPGNYLLGYQLLFDPEGAAAQLESEWAANGGLATDPTYAGISYYLAQSLRSLGDQDVSSWTSLPTSQVYTNAATGVRTVLIYNPAAAARTATVYHQGVAESTITVLPQTLEVRATPAAGSFEPAVAPATQLSWPTTAGSNYKVQWTASPTNGATWSDLTGLVAGDGTTQTVLVPPGTGAARAYRVQEWTTSVTTNVVNGGFEAGTGSSAANWTSLGSTPPFRVNTNAHSGSWCMRLANPNRATGGIQFRQAERAQGGTAIIPGLSYDFSFWAQQILNGIGLVQNYEIAWLDSGDGIVGTSGANFVGGDGYWSQLTASGLLAPSNAVDARITFNSTTGATDVWAGEVLIDDVALITSAPGPTNTLPVTVQSGWEISWSSARHVTYGVQRAQALGPASDWANLGSTLPGTGGTLSIFDLLGTNQARFYRVYVQP